MNFEVEKVSVIMIELTYYCGCYSIFFFVVEAILINLSVNFHLPT